MSSPDPVWKHAGGFRVFCLHEQSPSEARALCDAARQLRQVRRAAGYSRRELAAQLGVRLDVLVAIENGYGCLAIARPVVERAACLARDPHRAI